MKSDVSGSSFTSGTANGVVVQATSSEDIQGFVVAGGVGLWAGIAGAVSVGFFNSSTKAFIDSGATINTQSCTANASGCC